MLTQAYRLWAERRYPPAGRFMTVGGCRLHYLDTGAAGEEARGTVVLLHGASSNLVESMLAFGSGLASRYRVIAFDRPGHGWSERKADRGALEPARQAGVIAAALRRLGVRDAIIVGHSWAGIVVPHFGLDHRDVAGALVVLSGVTHPWPGGYAEWYDRLTASWLGWLLSRTLGVPVGLLFRPAAQERTFAPQAPPPGFVDRARIPLAFRPGTFLANARDFAVMHGAVVRQSPRYGEIRLPTVVIGGDRDRIVWSDLHSRSFARDVPGAELILLPEVGHMPQYARPEVVLAAIDGLAGRIVKRPRPPQA